MDKDMFRQVYALWACALGIYSPYNTWPFGWTVQSVSLPITFLSECSYSNPLKEPFWSLCGRPSHRPTLFSRLAALCLLSVSACPSWEPYHYLSKRCLINEPERWRLHPLAFKAIFSRSFPTPLHQLSSSTRTPLIKEWKPKRVGCSLPPLSPFYFKTRLFLLLSLQFQLSTLFFCTDGLKVLDS